MLDPPKRTLEAPAGRLDRTLVFVGLLSEFHVWGTSFFFHFPFSFPFDSPLLGLSIYMSVSKYIPYVTLIYTPYISPI